MYVHVTLSACDGHSQAVVTCLIQWHGQAAAVPSSVLGPILSRPNPGSDPHTTDGLFSRVQFLVDPGPKDWTFVGRGRDRALLADSDATMFGRWDILRMGWKDCRDGVLRDDT